LAASYRKKHLLFEICLELGECYAALGDMWAAELNLAEALDLQPMNPRSYISLARVAVRGEHLDKAESYLLRALELKPEADEALSVLGGVMLARGNRGAAWECFQRALELNDGDKDTLLGLVEAAEDLEKLKMVLPCLQEYVERHLLDFQVLYALAEVRHRLGQVEEALEMVGKILLFEPEHPQALALKAEIQHN